METKISPMLCTPYSLSMCLRKIIKNATVSCPFCRENFHVADVARLPNNGYVLHMLKLREQKGNKPINKKVPNFLGASVCPTCGSGIKDAGINQLATAIEKQKEAQKQLGVVMKSIQAAEEEVKKLQEENDFKLTQMVSVMEVKDNFVLKDSSVFILRIFQSGQLKGDIHISPYISRATTHFLKKLGNFCYKSPTNFNSIVDKAMPGVFVLLSMENLLQFQPDASDINNFTVEQACDYGEVGITSIYSLGNKVTEWSFVFILEDNEMFAERDNLPENVSNDCELIGRIGCFNVAEQLSRVRKSDRASYTITLESR